MLRSERNIASALAQMSPTIKFYALKTKRELESDLPEMAQLISDEQFIVDFNDLLRKSRRDHEWAYPISLALAAFCFTMGLILGKSMFWFVLMTTYCFSMYFMVKFMIEQRIKLRNLNFFKNFISIEAVRKAHFEAKRKAGGPQA